jgi:hypothetical protein
MISGTKSRELLFRELRFERDLPPLPSPCRVRRRADRRAGLGLAIAQRAIALHEGSIRAFNAPGGGLIVEIKFPTKEQPQEAQMRAPGNVGYFTSRDARESTTGWHSYRPTLPSAEPFGARE